MAKDFEFRKTKRTAFCRVCDKAQVKGSDVFYTYSSLNRGQHIYICLLCVDDITQEFESLE